MIRQNNKIALQCFFDHIQISELGLRRCMLLSFVLVAMPSSAETFAQINFIFIFFYFIFLSLTVWHRVLVLYLWTLLFFFFFFLFSLFPPDFHFPLSSTFCLCTKGTCIFRKKNSLFLVDVPASALRLSVNLSNSLYFVCILYISRHLQRVFSTFLVPPPQIFFYTYKA